MTRSLTIRIDRTPTAHVHERDVVIADLDFTLIDKRKHAQVYPILRRSDLKLSSVTALTVTGTRKKRPVTSSAAFDA